MLHPHSLQCHKLCTPSHFVDTEVSTKTATDVSSLTELNVITVGNSDLVGHHQAPPAPPLALMVWRRQQGPA